MAHNLLYININADYYARWWWWRGNQIFIGIYIKNISMLSRYNISLYMYNILNYHNYIFNF